jgi:hypothetical protein
MPKTTQEQEQEAINSILKSLNEIKAIKPKFIEQYLHFLETKKLFFLPFTSLMDTLRKSLGPTYSDPPQTKNTIEKLKLDTKKFLNISTSLSPTQNAGAQFEVENLINAIKNEMGITPLSPQTHLQSPDGQPMQQEECCFIQ